MHGLATQEGGREKEGREAGGRLRLGNQEYETMCGNGLRLRGGSEELVNGADEEEDGEPLSPLKEKVICPVMRPRRDWFPKDDGARQKQGERREYTAMLGERIRSAMTH
eukprot:1436166-Rhodomonas_salina.1